MRDRKRMLEQVDTGAFGGHNAKLILEAILDIRDKKTIDKKKRKQSDYNLFISKHMKQGKSMKEAAELWKVRK